MAGELFASLKCFDVWRAPELVTLNLPQKNFCLATYQSCDGVIVQHELAWLCCEEFTGCSKKWRISSRLGKVRNWS